MSTYLLEIGTEELPAAYISEAQVRIKELMSNALTGASISFGEIRCFCTPRRVAVLVADLPTLQPTTTRKVKGPPAKTSFNDDGSPKPQAAGFAAKQGIAVDDLIRELQGDVEYLIANVTTQGKPTADVLIDIAPKVISQLSGERMMRWGASDYKFSRPIRWLVSLLDQVVVPLEINGVVATHKSFGHRILAPQSVTIGTPATYVEDLRRAYVMVDQNERKQIIQEQVAELAHSLGGAARQLTGPLLDEVVNITEWPKAIVGDFGKEYLDLPDALIETVMVHHQKYFPVEVNSSHLLPHFIAVSNNDRESARDNIKQGNERVLKARLADGRFFFFDDQRTKLAERQTALTQLTFQEGLGNYADKVQRMERAAVQLGQSTKLDSVSQKKLVRVLQLCKADLVTNLVRELPELQGFVGAWYAEREGEDADVVKAIPSHYQPRFTDDAIPDDYIGQLASLVDKVDTLVGLFAIGKKPTGSSDPFAMRRQAQGLVDILMSGLTKDSIDLNGMFDDILISYEPFLSKIKKRVPDITVKTDLLEFIAQRVKGNLYAKASRREIVDAAFLTENLGDSLSNLNDLDKRISIIETLIKADWGTDLIRAGVRIGNILKAEAALPTDSLEVSDTLLVEPAEIDLWKALKSNFPDVGGDAVKDYDKLVDSLRRLSMPVDSFFKNVMVNDQDLAKRNNRRALLKKANLQFRSICDFAKLQPLIA